MKSYAGQAEFNKYFGAISHSKLTFLKHIDELLTLELLAAVSYLDLS